MHAIRECVTERLDFSVINRRWHAIYTYQAYKSGNLQRMQPLAQTYVHENVTWK